MHVICFFNLKFILVLQVLHDICMIIVKEPSNLLLFSNSCASGFIWQIMVKQDVQ